LAASRSYVQGVVLVVVDDAGAEVEINGIGCLAGNVERFEDGVGWEVVYLGGRLWPVGGHVVVAVASVRSGRGTLRPALRGDSKAWGLVSSWTRWGSM